MSQLYRCYIGRMNQDITIGFTVSAESKSEAIAKAQAHVEKMKKGVSLAELDLEEFFIYADKSLFLSEEDISEIEE